MSLYYDGARHFELMAIWSCYIISVIVRFSVASLHQKSRGLSPRLFVVCNSPPCGGAAACLTAEPVTVTADARGKVPGGFPVRIFVDAPPYGSVCTNTPHFSPFARLPFRSLFRPRSARPFVKILMFEMSDVSVNTSCVTV